MGIETKELPKELAQCISFSAKSFCLLTWLLGICQELKHFDKSAETNNKIQPLKAPWIIR